MNRPTSVNRSNLELIDDQYRRWRDDPTAVDPTWQAFFEGYELGVSHDGRTADAAAAGTEADWDAARAQAAVTRLIDAYREIGHYLANLDPLKLSPQLESHELLELASF